ncbi:hypothetical protein [Nitrospira sp. Kam-Ns4a]
MPLQTETRDVLLPAELPAATPAQEKLACSTPILCRPTVRVGLYAFLAILLLLMLVWRFLPAFTDPTFERHIQEKKVAVGMTREQVLKAWGGPYSINISYTKDGLRREEWIYEDWESPSVVKHRYLYFEEGLLVGGWYAK